MDVPSSFNVFDIFVKLIPGSILTAVIHLCLKADFSRLAYMKILLFIVVAYVVGSLIRVIARIFVLLTNFAVFHGDPRKKYTGEAGRLALNVIRDKGTRELVEK